MDLFSEKYILDGNMSVYFVRREGGDIIARCVDINHARFICQALNIIADCGKGGVPSDMIVERALGKEY
jgi:hypothetical protein